jgi:hypothetical protein
MAATAFKCVESYRRSILLTACAHPLHAVPVGGMLLVLLVSGFFLTALAVVALDLIGLVLLPPWRPLQRRIARCAERRARKRAAATLTTPVQRQWQSLDSAARRTEPFNPRRGEVESLLEAFLNIALAHHYARKCADTLAGHQSQAAGPLTEERVEAHRRAERAIEALGAELDATAERIQLACDRAVAEQCEAGVDLWLSELQGGKCSPPSLAPMGGSASPAK